MKVVGLVELEGSYTTVSGLTIDGSNNLYDVQRAGTSCPYPVSNGLEIDGVGDIFQNNDFYQSIPSLRGSGSASAGITLPTTRSSVTTASMTSGNAWPLTR